MGEFATPLTALAHIQSLDRPNRTILPDQVELFYLRLVDILRKKKVKFGNVFQPIYYNDEGNYHLNFKNLVRSEFIMLRVIWS